MLSKKTVFILGAGASKPYGFPTAFGLSDKVILNSSELIKSIMRKYEQTEQIIKDHESIFNMGFLNNFKKAHNSRPISIDDFLSKENNFAFYRSHGLKLMIHYLMMLERENRKLDKSDWIEFLIDKMTKGIKFLVENGELEKNINNVRIMTFNYERSFEYLVLKRLIETYSEDQAKFFLRLFTRNIIHIYGSIGKILDSVSENSIESGFCPYGYCADDYELSTINDNIKLIYDEREESELIKIQEFFIDVEQIFFLGFGYEEFNIANLYLNSIENPNVKIYGTIKGKVQHIDSIRESILQQDNKFDKNNLILEDVDCKTLLKNTYRELSNILAFVSFEHSVFNLFINNKIFLILFLFSPYICR